MINFVVSRVCCGDHEAQDIRSDADVLLSHGLLSRLHCLMDCILFYLYGQIEGVQQSHKEEEG